MIAEKDIHMKAAAKEMYVLSADELIEQRCRARDDFRKQENSRNRIMKELTDALESKDKELEVQKMELEVQKQELEVQKQELEIIDQALRNAMDEIELLKQQLTEALKHQ